MTLEQFEKALPVVQQYRQDKNNLSSMLRAQREYVLDNRSTNLRLKDFPSEKSFFDARKKENAERSTNLQRSIERLEEQLKQVEEKIITDLAKI